MQTGQAPEPRRSSIDRIRPHVYVLGLLVFNSLIGLAFWAARGGDAVLPYLVVANAIGLSADVLTKLLNRLTHDRLGLMARALIVGPLSVIIGVEVAALTVSDVPRFFGQHSGVSSLLSVLPTFLATSAACAFVAFLFRSIRIREALEMERRIAAELRQSETAARLALLQAQIEPHFLFNTLANVQSLIERDPRRASSMLDSLNRYLRASLGRTRKPVSSVDEELELVDALLRIASVRLGDRLTYGIDVPHALRQLALPPLLLQPLVENALLHGIEPAIDGGDIRIVVMRDGDRLELSVFDTGVGLGNSGSVHGGVGLANVRERLKSLYGNDATLSIGSNDRAMQGVISTLSIPIR